MYCVVPAVEFFVQALVEKGITNTLLSSPLVFHFLLEMAKFNCDATDDGPTLASGSTELNPFVVFGISTREQALATGSRELGTIYRKMCLQFHPDKNSKDPPTSSKFCELTESFEMISDPLRLPHLIDRHFPSPRIAQEIRNSDARVMPGVTLMQGYLNQAFCERARGPTRFHHASSKGQRSIACTSKNELSKIRARPYLLPKSCRTDGQKRKEELNK
eukprot:11754684-Karenia_brevis.AAC.1